VTGRRLAALLRGVNVGGRHRVPMAELRTLLTEQGLSDVRTYLNSGNVVFQCAAEAELVDGLVGRLEAALLARFGFPVPLFLRTALELQAIQKADPLAGRAERDPTRLMVMFLNQTPDADTVSSLAPACRDGEQLFAGPGCLYIWFPNGAGQSRLVPSALEKRLGPGTMRNWNTLTTLAGMIMED
jgi:uncharacterized protein (DUF1697 family)